MIPRNTSRRLNKAIANGAWNCAPGGPECRPGPLVRLAMVRRLGLARAAHFMYLPPKILWAWMYQNPDLSGWHR